MLDVVTIAGSPAAPSRCAAALDAAGIEAALRRYEKVMRPYVDRCQDLPAGLDGYAPLSERDISIGAAVMKWVQRWPLRLWAGAAPCAAR